MKVEAIKTENGFLIPLTGRFKNIKKDKILLELEVLDPEIIEEVYDPLDQLIGICETGIKDASVNHDRILYSEKDDDIR